MSEPTQEQIDLLAKWNQDSYPESKISEASVEFPNLLMERIPDLRLKLGGMKQVELEIKEWLSFRNESKEYPVVRPLRTSPLNLGIGKVMRVLDDESIPTVNDWLPFVGKKVCWNFYCAELNPANKLKEFAEIPVYRCHATFLVIPS